MASSTSSVVGPVYPQEAEELLHLSLLTSKPSTRRKRIRGASVTPKAILWYHSVVFPQFLMVGHCVLKQLPSSLGYDVAQVFSTR